MIWIVLIITGAIAAVIAQSKGRSGLGWFIYGACFPGIAIIHALCIKENKDTKKQCPDCRSWVDRKAKVCKNCSYRFTKKEMQVLVEEEQAKQENLNSRNKVAAVVLVIVIIAGICIINYIKAMNP